MGHIKYRRVIWTTFLFWTYQEMYYNHEGIPEVNKTQRNEVSSFHNNKFITKKLLFKGNKLQDF